MAGVQRADVGKLAGDNIQRRQPLRQVPVGGVGVRAVEGQIAGERDRAAAAEG